MRKNPLILSALLLVAAFLNAPSVGAQIAYQTPPAELLRVLQAPASPVASVSPVRHWVLVSTSDPRSISIRDMAEPAYYLAGSKIRATPDSKIENIGIQTATISNVDGKTKRALTVPDGGRIGSIAWSRDDQSLAYTTISNGAMKLYAIKLPSGQPLPITGAGLAGRLRDLTWSPDGKHIAFTAATSAGVSLWAGDWNGTARKLTSPNINFVRSAGNRGEETACSWTDDTDLRCRLFPATHGAPPKEPDVPLGPIVQESFGRSAPARTYEYLLSSPYDEALFDYYFTDQLTAVSLDGKQTKIGTPGIHTTVSPSPDGKYLLVQTVQRPYSYQVPLNAFPSRTEIWSSRGDVIKLIRNSPVAVDAPSMRDATIPGIRNAGWRTDAPATIVTIEALDNGDPRVKATKRDRVSMLSAPFTGSPATLAETEYRVSGITWAAPNAAFLTERLSRGARTRTWLIDPSAPNRGTPRLVWDRSSEDRYTDPGTWVLTRDVVTDRELPLRSADGRSLYLAGSGASPEGEHPFLDRFDLTSAKTTRLWQVSGTSFDSLLAVVDPEATRIITRHETPADPPNYFVRDLRSQSATQLTQLGDPAPYFAGVKTELITYTRPDGVKLSATMYLPPGYDKSQGPLPFFFWAYPREFQSDSAASQLAGSPYQFKRPTRANYMLLLLHGYGILDGPTMPIVGRNGTEPNDTYVQQLVASAQAAVDKIVALGVGDRNRVAVGGHSYGAFMTANLLAHTDIFRAGIAESGAYNRTLTPFGFQSEPRNYWEAEEVYNAMSPFNYADKIKTPILLIHGQRDDNSGTFPINSERLFAAIKGLGGNVRYVQLPLEPHGYTSVETQRHLLWEYVNWLDKYVKNAPARAAASSGSGQ
jgi:Dipeptidyl aminopeptidases/acylaminoacyl-peptidases